MAEEAGCAHDKILEPVASVSQKISKPRPRKELVRASSPGQSQSIDLVSSVVEQKSAAAEEMAANSEQVNNPVEVVVPVTTQDAAVVREMSASSEETTARV